MSLIINGVMEILACDVSNDFLCMNIPLPTILLFCFLDVIVYLGVLCYLWLMTERQNIVVCK